MNYFSESYTQGRKKFCDAAQQAGLEVITHTNPHAKTPDNQPLTTDVAWCGSTQATKILLVTCGTHGLEAASGSATIIQWLATKQYKKLPNDIAVIFVHALNPYGWAYNSRTNEDNVDINRNFLSRQNNKPDNPVYAELHEFMMSDDISISSLESSIELFEDYAQKHGRGNAIHGITGGQYDNPQGLSYGGFQQSWSVKTLNNKVQTFLPDAEKVAAIDWHTGIGEFAQPFMITGDETGSEEHKRAAAWWGENLLHNHNIFDDSIRPDYSGLLANGLEAEINKLDNVQLLAVTVEFGTYPLNSMIQALMMDNWIRFRSTDHSSVEHLTTKTRLIERFNPSAYEWRIGVLKHAERIYQQTLTGLAQW